MNDGMKLEAISFSRKGKPILSNIDLQIEKGEILGLIGPNGAGKTTLMKRMIRGLRSDKGTLSLEGKIVATAPPEEMLTAESLRRVYGIDAERSHHSTSGRLCMLPIRISGRSGPKRDGNKEASRGHA